MPVACTVVTRSHLPQARVLAESFVEQHRSGEFAVLLLDDDELTVGAGEPFTVVRPEALGLGDAEFRRRGAMFGPLGLVSSMKPQLLRQLVDRFGAALFIDADSYVYDDLSYVIDLAVEQGVVLSPHLSYPLSLEEAGWPLEETFLRYGVFNSGFLGVGRRGEAFLDWWCDRTTRRCIEAPDDGYNYAQYWLTHAPAYFDVKVLRDPGINVMWWNLYDRDVDWRGSVPWVSDVPLRHFHFTGLDPADPTKFGHKNDAERANFPGLEQRPGTNRLCREYADRVIAAGLVEARRISAPFVWLADGERFSEEARTSYRRAVEAAEQRGTPEPPNPFDQPE